MKKNRRSLKVGDPLPKSLGQCADFYNEVKELRLAMAKEVKAIMDRESEIREHIIETLPVGDRGAVGIRYKAIVTSDEKPTADDWDLIYDYIAENDRFDLLGKSLNAKAVQELWDNNVKIPGISKFNAKKVSITKI